MDELQLSDSLMNGEFTMEGCTTIGGCAISNESTDGWLSMRDLAARQEEEGECESWGPVEPADRLYYLSSFDSEGFTLSWTTNTTNVSASLPVGVEVELRYAEAPEPEIVYPDDMPGTTIESLLNETFDERVDRLARETQELYDD